MACEFDALADLEELQIEKSPETPNTRLQIRLELQVASEPGTEHFLIYFVEEQSVKTSSSCRDG